MIFNNITGIPNFDCDEYSPKHTKYCLIIPIINEGSNIIKQLKKTKKNGINQLCDIIICDGGSTDKSTDANLLKSLGVNTLLTKQDIGKQGAQLRMGFWWALKRGYKGIITIDGNNKDSIEDIPVFIKKLNEKYDFVQGSRFIRGGKAINTPLLRYISVRFVHAPIISITAKHWYTDTTNAYRAYSKNYLLHPMVQPFRNCFTTYELLAYLSVRANQLHMKTCEIAVTRKYPKNRNVPTKINSFKGHYDLFEILLKNLLGAYNP